MAMLLAIGLLFRLAKLVMEAVARNANAWIKLL
jgi:hypothetical protein